MNDADFAVYPISYADNFLRYESSFCLKPIVAGAALLETGLRDAYRSKGYILDDEDAESLSPYNPYWGELTAIQWILKHAEEDVIGHAHYRRRWHDSHIRIMHDDVLYVPPKVKLPNGQNLGEQFEWVNYEGRDFVGKFNALAERGMLPMTLDCAREMWASNFIHPCLMSLGPREKYKKLMEMLFEVLFPFWTEYEEEIRSMRGYSARVMAFLAERVMTGLLMNKEYFLGSVKIEFGGMQLSPMGVKPD